MIARLALTAALLGSAVGATVVLAADHEPPPSKPTPPAIASATPTPAPKSPPLEVRNLRQVQEIPDPEGGAPWVVRHFDTTVKLRRRAAPNACWELGRLQGGTFGWIDGHGTFAPQAPGRYKVPVTCGQLGRGELGPQRFTRLTYPPGGQPKPAQVITWGVAKAGAARLEIDGEAPIDIAPNGFYLQITGPRPLGALIGAFVAADGKRSRFGAALMHGRRGGRPKPGPARVAVRAPDPAGGQPWGILAQAGERGGVCFGYPERLVVGDQPGWIDHERDLFTVFPGVEMSCAREAPTRGYPLRLDTMISGVPNNQDRGEIERRVLTNRVIFWGRAHRDVVSVTIKTPRDVRTLIPTADHFVLAVYDGQFPGGRATATAKLRNGKEVTRSLYVE